MGIIFRNVGFSYEGKASQEFLHNINLEIESKNEFIAILGHTGSGKSTLVQLMNALNLPTTGEVEIFGQKITNKYTGKLKEVRHHVGLVFQFPEYQLFEETVLKDVMFGPLNFSKDQKKALEEAKKACKMVGLTDDLLERSPFTLSGGQMRKVAIAGILASNPDVLVLDEPTVGLDPQGKYELMNLLVKIQETTNKTIIVITHDMNVVAGFAKRTIVLDNGEIVYDGKKADLFANIERLKSFNLDLPDVAKLAIALKNRGLINYHNLPLTKEELASVIIGGHQDE